MIKVKKRISLIFLILTLFTSGCFQDKKEVGIIEDIVLEYSGSMSFGENSVYKVYYMKVETTKHIKNVELYFDNSLSEESILSTSFDGYTAVFDKNILILSDANIKELVIVITEENNSKIIIKKEI